MWGECWGVAFRVPGLLEKGRNPWGRQHGPLLMRTGSRWALECILPWLSYLLFHVQPRAGPGCRVWEGEEKHWEIDVSFLFPENSNPSFPGVILWEFWKELTEIMVPVPAFYQVWKIGETLGLGTGFPEFIADRPLILGADNCMREGFLQELLVGAPNGIMRS